MTSKVVALQIKPGIQRDGTQFNSPCYVDGQWVRFQSGLPRKMGGYKGIFLDAAGISRGMIMSASNGLNYIVSGYSGGLQQWVTAATDGVGTGPVNFTLNSFSANANNLWQMDIGYDSTGGGSNMLIAHPGQNLTDITSTVNTRPLFGQFTGTTLNPVGVFTASGTITSSSNQMTFATTILGVGPGVSVSGTGIPAGTTVVSAIVTGGVYTVTLSANATSSGTYTFTFDNNISVSGGVVMLYPYLFAYGNNGLIQNCAAGDFNNWTQGDANANNVSSTKVVKGLPLRGGTTSPAGLFWTLDSVVRVTYAPQSVGSVNYYWRYDLITQQSSIMSSQCVIEYDGIFYWAGVDRFLMYNGVVQEIPNSQNQNWFFDNLNYQQRQKVWVSKIPRWGEIWFFYPRGSATECTDAVVYNVREKVWYDAGQSPAATRSAGAFSEVFRFPVWGGNVSQGYQITSVTINASGTGYAVNDTITVSGGAGNPPAALIVTSVSGSSVTGLSIINGGSYPNPLVGITSTIARAPSGGTGLTITATMSQFYTLWQHETGTDQIYTDQVNAINSYFETPSLGTYAGLVGSQQQPGDNMWTRCERIEPDFVQSGQMSVIVTGKGYADDTDITSDPYYFDPTTLKVDMREQRREMRLRFQSNTLGGNYYMGRVILSLDTGDVRGTGNP